MTTFWSLVSLIFYASTVLAFIAYDYIYSKIRKFFIMRKKGKDYNTYFTYHNENPQEKKRHGFTNYYDRSPSDNSSPHRVGNYFNGTRFKRKD